MNIQPTLELHPEYNIPQGSSVDSKCFGLCFRSTPKEYTIDDSYKLKRVSRPNYEARVLANQRLATLLSHDLDHDPLAMNDLFERLKHRVNYDITNGSKLTSEKLASIINILYEVKLERDYISLRPKQTRVSNMPRAKRISRNPNSRAKLP